MPTDRTKRLIEACLSTALIVPGFLLAQGAAAYDDDDCIRCHREAVQSMVDGGGKHRDVGCTTCHDGHPPAIEHPFPDCSLCHEPHSVDPASSDCARCHRAHAPAVVEYAVDVPSQACGACHTDALAELAASATKHGTLSCAICHRAVHGATRACGDCHGRLHPQAIMDRFPSCADCHHTAHDLNHWPEQP
jgi:hypothetical protein